MKDKILMLIIGALLGAIITAGCFILFSNDKGAKDFEGRGKGNMGQMEPMGNFTPGDMSKPPEQEDDTTNNDI